MKRNQGFTLIEIMIVVLIIGMLAAIAIPSFVRARDSARTNTCINNLRQIDSAKEMWAMEENKGDTDTPTWEELGEYIRGVEGDTTALECPADGDYTIGNVITLPTCDVEDHELPGTPAATS